MPHRWRIFVVVLLLCGASDRLHAQSPRNHVITLDDYFTQADVFQIAHGERYSAYTEGRWNEATDDRKSDLWLVDAKLRLSRRLTADRAGDRSPQFDRDEQFVYFLGNRKREGEKQPPYDGKSQVWRIPVHGGTPEPVTRVAGGIDAYQLVGNQLFYLVHEDKVQDDWSGLRAKFKHLEYGHGLNRLGQIWKLDVNNWRSEKVVDDQRNIREFTVSADGKRIGMITTPDDKVVSFEGQSRVDVHDASTGKITTVPDDAYRKKAASPYAWLEHIAWSAQGDKLAFGVVFDGYPAEIAVSVWHAGKASTHLMPRSEGLHIKGYGSQLQWSASGDSLYFLGEQKARVRLQCVGVRVPFADRCEFGGVDEVTAGDVVVEQFSLSSDPKNAQAFSVLMATPTKFADLYRKDAGELTQVTKVNPQVDRWKLPQVSIVKWKGADGVPVEGILELPHDYKPGQKLPLVVEIHGGPTTSTLFKLQYWIYGRTLLAAKGYAVLCPNYRGSIGYGDKFTTDLIGRENDLDVQDILAGVDELVKQGIADPDKLAVSGWSNGGYLTNCIITKTNRFKAAISGASIVDAIMEWGSNDEPAYAMVFKQGLPWNSAEKYHKASPTYQLDKARTPTLIHVGANDERCPPAQSRMLYRALKEYGHVPTELIVYPGESHGLMKYRSRRAKMEWDLAWLNRYVMGKTK
jgi:dipeptidyl aminopeptidase/acylaminoacyl peptidase